MLNFLAFYNDACRDPITKGLEAVFYNLQAQLLYRNDTSNTFTPFYQINLGVLPKQFRSEPKLPL